jgi:hypothetical protein
MIGLDPSFAMGFTFALIVAIIALFAWERYPIEIIGIGAIAVMMIVFQIAPVRDADGHNLLDAGVLLSGFEAWSPWS